MWRNGAQCGALQLPLPVAWVQTSLGEDFFYKNVMILLSQRCNIASMLASSGKAPYPQLISSHSSLDSALNDYLVPGYKRDGNMYDKFNVPKWLQVCTRLTVGLKRHTNNLINNQIMGFQVNLQFFHYIRLVKDLPGPLIPKIPGLSVAVDNHLRYHKMLDMLILSYKPPSALKMILCLHRGSISAVNIRCIRDKPLLNYPLGRFIFWGFKSVV